MKRTAKLLQWVLGLFVALFVVLWVLGPTPVSLGPYVQNVTATAAEVCAFDEVACRVRVVLRSEATEPVVVVEAEAV
ncbi:MAG: hypothetical protein VX951_13355, partial [Planctomycetota bacterium]|nr:hypothetical protein [Planctomycetota bacterium]